MEEPALSEIDPRLKKQMETASRAVDKGNPGYALPVCSEVLKRHPGCVEVRQILRRAQRRMHAGGSSTGKKLLLKFSMGPFKRSGSNLMKKDPLKGMSQAEDQLAKDPENLAAHDFLGACAEQLKLWKTAVLAYESIRDLDPGNVDNLKKLTRAYIAAGAMEKAVETGDRILSQNPGDGEAQNLVRQASVSFSLKEGGWEREGKYRHQLKDEETARGLEQEGRAMSDRDSLEQQIARLLTEVEAEPEQLQRYLSLAECFRKVGAPQQALEWVQRARGTRTGSKDVSLERLENRYHEAVLEEGITLARKNLDYDPDSIPLQEALRQAKETLIVFRLEQARFLVERYPNDMEARFDYGKLLLEQGSVDDALAHLQVAQKNPKLRGHSLLLLGKAYALKQFYDLAARQLEQAKAQNPEADDFKKEVLYELAGYYEALGDRERAASELKTLYSADIGYRDVGERIKTFYSGT